MIYVAIIHGNPGPAAISSADVHAALLVLIEAARAPGDSVTKWELIRAIVESANSGRLQPPIGSTIEVNGQVFIQAADLERCAELKKELAAIARRELPAKTRAKIREAGRQLAMVPTGNGETRLFPLDPSAVLSHGLTMLLDEPEFNTQLKQCTFPGCGKFFLANDQVNPGDRGRRQYKYCRKHTGERTAGALRQQRYRDKAKKAVAAAKHK